MVLVNLFRGSMSLQSSAKEAHAVNTVERLAVINEQVVTEATTAGCYRY